jgi:hypothetical protein
VSWVSFMSIIIPRMIGPITPLQTQTMLEIRDHL